MSDFNSICRRLMVIFLPLMWILFLSCMLNDGKSSYEILVFGSLFISACIIFFGGLLFSIIHWILTGKGGPIIDKLGE